MTTAYGSTEMGATAFGFPGGGPTWNALRLPGPEWTDHMRLVESSVPGHVIFSVMRSFPAAAMGLLESVDKATGRMKVGTREKQVLDESACS